ncbi:Inorganic pyrophosphatase [Papilio xuthus]|uniref:Inorganic pyrophosphatase n=1 Tax=Papilio xuthus TaxID=66420 RepID=A0A0N0P9B8_PAPXU|nr:Inorganic pyrophosphatase [Papilio xuthus]
MFIAEERGSPYAPDYRVFFRDESGPVSPLHDIPLWADRARRLANMVVEVPRWTNAKMEISLGETLNPIKQDVKKGALRYVSNVFPHHGYIWNYGALPQTWEDPRHVDPGTGARGDNDPIDVIEIGSRVAQRGDVLTVKILGALALIDEGETDWKLIAIDARDPDAERLSDVADLEKVRPGLLRATLEWFRLYKVPDGKPVNVFAFDGEAKDAAFAHRVIDEVHEFWRALVSGEAEASDICKSNVSVAGSAHRVPRDQAAAALAAAPPPAQPQALPDTGVVRGRGLFVRGRGVRLRGAGRGARDAGRVARHGAAVVRRPESQAVACS